MTTPATLPASATPCVAGGSSHAGWADAEPLSGATLDEFADAIAADALIVGVGESTRFARETFGVRDKLSRRLIQRHGFRALAIQDSADVAAELDRYVRLGIGSAESALDAAWRPWRTFEMVGALQWIRAFNSTHPDSPVRIFGVKPRQAQPADYDAILDYVRRSAPGRLNDVTAQLAPIRTAHDTDEHVQRARGTHPGRPFAHHARDALALIELLPGVDDEILTRMRLIVEFHRDSVAGRGSYAGDAALWADTVSNHQQRSGLRMVYWDGIAHTTAAPPTLGLAPERGPQPSVGSLLRSRYGSRYRSVAIGFHHGNLGATTVPEPAPDLVDSTLGKTDLPAQWLDLRRQIRAWNRPAKLRVISGVYNPSRDAAEHMTVASLAEAFDMLVHIRQVSPVRPMPSRAPEGL
jgi:erythromycin esterase